MVLVAALAPAWASAGPDLPDLPLPTLPTLPTVTAPPAGPPTATAPRPAPARPRVRAQSGPGHFTPADTAEVLGDPCPVDSWVAGSVEWCDGVLVYRDYLHDDHGADRDQVLPRSDAHGALPPAGDVRYPEGQENTADLVAFRMRLRGDRLHVEFELNTLYQPGGTYAVVAFDTDDDRTTGGGPIGALGVQSRGWEEWHLLAHGDPATNVLAAEVPRPPGTRWRVQALVGVPAGPAMNVAFRGTDEYGFWW
jgi:hypothetical protein